MWSQDRDHGAADRTGQERTREDRTESSRVDEWKRIWFGERRWFAEGNRREKGGGERERQSMFVREREGKRERGKVAQGLSDGFLL